VHSKSKNTRSTLLEILLKTIRNSNERGFPKRVFQKISNLIYRFQIKHNSVYRNWIRVSKTYLPIIAFKESNVCSFHYGSASRKQSALHRSTATNNNFYFESSGTTNSGKPIVSRHRFRSLDLYRTSVVEGWKWFLRESKLHSPLNFVGLMPSYAEKPHSSLSCMVNILMKEFGDDQGLWIMKSNRWDWRKLYRHLRVSEKSRQPSVLFGTAFGWVHFLDWCSSQRFEFRLPANSIILETGGYKGKSRELERNDLHRCLSKLFQLSPNQIRSEYSMCELSSQAYSFPQQKHRRGLLCHIFRFPPWCQYQIVHPLSSTKVRTGGTGVLEICDLANIDSCAFIRTEDLAVSHPGGFEIVGRLPKAGLKGCSLAFE